MSESIDKMIVDVKKAGENGADIVEIRLDALKIFNPHEDLKILIKESPLPTLFTYRYLAGIFPPQHYVLLSDEVIISHCYSLLDWANVGVLDQFCIVISCWSWSILIFPPFLSNLGTRCIWHFN